jgi:hypothetical protein
VTLDGGNRHEAGKSCSIGIHFERRAAGFVGGLNVGCKRKKRVRNVSQATGGKEEPVLHLGKTVGGAGLEGDTQKYLTCSWVSSEDTE